MSFICPLVYRTLSPLLEEEEERDEEKLFKRGVLHITSPCSQQWHKARMRCARALWEKLIHKSGELVPFPYILFAEALFHRVSFVLSAAAAAAAFSALSRLGWRESVKSRYERDARRRRDNSTRSLAFPHTYTHTLFLSHSTTVDDERRKSNIEIREEEGKRQEERRLLYPHNAQCYWQASSHIPCIVAAAATKMDTDKTR